MWWAGMIDGDIVQDFLQITLQEALKSKNDTLLTHRRLPSKHLQISQSIELVRLKRFEQLVHDTVAIGTNCFRHLTLLLRLRLYLQRLRSETSLSYNSVSQPVGTLACYANSLRHDRWSALVASADSTLSW